MMGMVFFGTEMTQFQKLTKKSMLSCLSSIFCTYVCILSANTFPVTQTATILDLKGKGNTHIHNYNSTLFTDIGKKITISGPPPPLLLKFPTLLHHPFSNHCFFWTDFAIYCYVVLVSHFLCGLIVVLHLNAEGTHTTKTSGTKETVNIKLLMNQNPAVRLDFSRFKAFSR